MSSNRCGDMHTWLNPARHTYRNGGLLPSIEGCFHSRACTRWWPSLTGGGVSREGCCCSRACTRWGLNFAGGGVGSVGILELLDVLLAHCSMVHHGFGVVHPYPAVGLLLICNGGLPGLIDPLGREVLQAQVLTSLRFHRLGICSADCCKHAICSQGLQTHEGHATKRP